MNDKIEIINGTCLNAFNLTPITIEHSLKEIEQQLEQKISLRWMQFLKQKEAFVNYLKENNIKLSQQERETMTETAAVEKEIQELRFHLNQVEMDLENIQMQVKSTEDSIEREKKHFANQKTEIDKKTANLNKTYKAYQVAVAYYEKYLGLKVTNVNGNEIEFACGGENLKLIWEKDGFLVEPDHRMESGKELLAYLHQKRLK